MARTSWWCTRCSRILSHDVIKRGARDTVSAVDRNPKAIVHDRCGGPVALSQRLGLK